MKRVLFACLSVFIFAGCTGNLSKNGEEPVVKPLTWNSKIEKFANCDEVDAYIQEHRGSPMPMETISHPAEISGSDQAYDPQVEGVIEGDILQISPAFFFYATPNKIEVIRRTPFAFYKSFLTPNSYARSILFYNGKLIYVGHDYAKTTVQIYSVKEEDIQKIYEKEFVGSMVDFRLVGDQLRLVTQYFSYGQRTVSRRLNCAQIYRPNMEDGDSSITFVNTVNLSDGSFTSDSTGYMGQSSFLYMTSDELLLFSNGYSFPGYFRVVKLGSQESTLDQVQTYQGFIKDRWSVLVKDHSIIFASTVASSPNNPLASPENKIFTYEKMRGLQYEKAFETPAFGHNETIQSVRYFMDKAYVVTFEQTDPLFVFDIKDPRSIKLLGSLESPGFSTQLRELTNGIMFGLGYTENQGYFKVSLFDVLDPLKPSEAQTLIWGSNDSISYSSSQAIRDTKALFISQEKNRIIFPAQIRKVLRPSNFPAFPNVPALIDPQQGTDIITYELFAGALILNFDGNHIQEVGRVTHRALREKYCSGSLYYPAPPSLDVQRAVQIQGNIFSFSLFGVLRSSAAEFTTEEQVAFDASGVNCQGGY